MKLLITGVLVFLAGVTADLMGWLQPFVDPMLAAGTVIVCYAILRNADTWGRK